MVGQPPVAPLRTAEGQRQYQSLLQHAADRGVVPGVRPADARWRLVTSLVDSQPGVAAVDEQSAVLAAERSNDFSWVRARADERTLARSRDASVLEFIENARNADKVVRPRLFRPRVGRRRHAAHDASYDAGVAGRFRSKVAARTHSANSSTMVRPFRCWRGMRRSTGCCSTCSPPLDGIS